MYAQFLRFTTQLCFLFSLSILCLPHKVTAHEDEHDKHDEANIEKIIVQATRSGRIADDQPVRVELINQEEIQEKAAMRPGNISMLVAETGGVRMQTTSPALGSANIRLQGLYGRYTQLLSDGLPLYGNQAASIGLLQIPPTDLERVEIIKGSASSLYGGSALGGVINLVSRRPGEEFKGEALVNATTRGGQDLTTYVETPLNEQLKGSVTAGAHHQRKIDIDNDGWADLAGYERYTLRPRLFWDGSEGEQLYATVGYMKENREGGTVEGGTVGGSENGQPFERSLYSERLDSGLSFEKPLSDTLTSVTRLSAMSQKHTHQFGSALVNQEIDKHESYLAETSLSGYSDKSDWLVGVAFQSNIYHSDTFPQFDYRYEVPGLFTQIDYQLNSDVTASMSARLDEHSEFGTQFSPRVSFLYRPNALTIRGSYGTGYFAPTPFVEEIEAAGLSRLSPIEGLEEEQAETASLDVTYRFDNIETSLTVFGSNVDNVTRLETLAGSVGESQPGVRLVNADGESRIRGSELLLRYYWHDLKLTASYLYLDATEVTPQSSQRRTLALTPEHSAGFVAMWEEHGKFMLGFEAYYTGVQRVDDNPYLTHTRPYWHLGLLGQITQGRYNFFLNLENLLDVQQTDEHPLILPSQSVSGRWTTDIWSRNDGFIANAGMRITF